MTSAEARKYIKYFKKYVFFKSGLDEVEFSNGDIIKLDNMTDDEAVRAAGGLKSIEAEAARRSIKRMGRAGRQ